jgi:cell division protein FtsQ
MEDKKKSRVLALVATAMILGLLTYILGWSPLLSVEKITLTGTPTPASTQRIREAIQISPGLKMARINPRALENRITQFPWVESAGISRDWISGELTIEVTTRKPIALYNSSDSATTWIDSAGEIFTLPGGVPKALPRVQGSSPEDGLRAIELFTQLPLEFRERIVYVSASRTDQYLVVIEEKKREVRLLWGANKDLDLKIAVIDKLLGLPENKKVSMIDLTAPHAPIVG